MAVSMSVSTSSINRYRRALSMLGWAQTPQSNDDTDAVQAIISDSHGVTGILLRLDSLPSFFVRISDQPISDPLDIYHALVFGWNLEAPFTAIPVPRDLLCIYNTTRKPHKSAVVLGEEAPIAEVSLSNVLNIEDVQRVTGQLMLLTPDTWRSRSYEEFLASPTGSGRLTVDNALIHDLQEWRLALVRNFYNVHGQQDSQQDADSSLRTLDKAAQQILDEIIFIRFCEDRGLTTIEPLFDIASTTKGEDFLARFSAIVERYDALFDTDIFNPALTDELRPPPSLLQAIIAESVELYKFDILSVDVLGRIYEEYLSYELTMDVSGPLYDRKMELRKSQGIYYTPSPIVEYLVKRAIYVFQETQHREVSSAIDLASGSGIFLTTLISELVKGMSFDEKRTLVEKSIYGIDVDERAVRRSTQAIYYHLLTDAHRRLMGHHLLPQLLGENLFVKDALVDRKHLVDDRRFDIIVSNPPYLRINGEQLAQYRVMYSDVIVSQSELCWLMLVAAIDNLNEGGIVAFIVPDNMLRTMEYSRLRQYILDTTRIVEISYLNYQAFESTALQNILLILQRESSHAKRQANIIEVHYYATPGEFRNQASDAVPQASFVNADLDYIFNVRLTAPIRAIYEKIKAHSETVSTYFTVSQGIKPDREKMGRVPIRPSDKKYLLGKDIRPYAVSWSGTYYDYDPMSVPDTSNVRLRDPALFESPIKLIMRQIVDDLLVVALDEEQYYVAAAAHILRPRVEATDDIIYLALAMLTSPFAKFFYQVEYPEWKTAFPQIRGRDIDRLPLPTFALYTEAGRPLTEAIIAQTKQLYERVRRGEVGGPRVYRMDEAGSINKLLAQLYHLTDEDLYLIDVYRSGRGV